MRTFKPSKHRSMAEGPPNKETDVQNTHGGYSPQFLIHPVVEESFPLTEEEKTLQKKYKKQ